MKDLDLKSLRLFLAVCEAGNIKRAAQAAHIEPSAVSKRIAQLEADLQTRLLLRSRRGVQPTPAGHALLEHARALQHTLERIEADVSAYAGGIQGHVRLVASPSAVAESLLDDIALFLRDPQNQGIKLDIEERLSVEVVQAVREGSASLGVCWDSARVADLSRVPYRRDELVLAVHPAHPRGLPRDDGGGAEGRHGEPARGPGQASEGVGLVSGVLGHAREGCWMRGLQQQRTDAAHQCGERPVHFPDRAFRAEETFVIALGHLLGPVWETVRRARDGLSECGRERTRQSGEPRTHSDQLTGTGTARRSLRGRA